MSETTFFVSQAGKPQGPWSKQSIRQKVKSGDLSLSDYIWLNEDEEWKMLAHFFVADFPPPDAPPPGVKLKGRAKKSTDEDLREYSGASFTEQIGISNESIWFLYKDKSKFGPYRYLEIVSLIQKNAFTPDDFVWKPGMSDWERIRLTSDFSDEILKKLSHMKNYSAEKIFLKRRFPRVPYDTEVIIHDDQCVVFGSARKLSEGGAFLEVKKPSHTKGDRLKVHFTPGGVDVPFNCIAEVISVSKTKPVGYSVKFIYLEEADRKRIAQFAESVSEG